jgi:hypothetical protein
METRWNEVAEPIYQPFPGVFRAVTRIMGQRRPRLE